MYTESYLTRQTLFSLFCIFFEFIFFRTRKPAQTLAFPFSNLFKKIYEQSIKTHPLALHIQNHNNKRASEHTSREIPHYHHTHQHYRRRLPSSMEHSVHSPRAHPRLRHKLAPNNFPLDRESLQSLFIGHWCNRPPPKFNRHNAPHRIFH